MRAGNRSRRSGKSRKTVPALVDFSLERLDQRKSGLALLLEEAGYKRSRDLQKIIAIKKFDRTNHGNDQKSVAQSLLDQPRPATVIHRYVCLLIYVLKISHHTPLPYY